MIIRHLKHSDIDKIQWDHFISTASNSLIYAQSWYLDTVSPQWEALITDDFKYAMPVPIKRKYKIPYIAQPLLTQQLGIFGQEPVTPEIIRKFIRKLPSYSYQLSLNAFNFLPEAYPHPNYILPLNSNYDMLVKAYSKNVVRNIAKAAKCKLSIIYDFGIDSFISFYQTNKAPACVNYKNLKELISKGFQCNAFKIRAVTDDENTPLAALCYSEYDNRLIYLLPVSNEKGKKAFAMFYLVDSIIREESGKNKILDFEGSKIESIARFYKGFGAKNQPYYIIKNLRPSFLIGR